MRNPDSELFEFADASVMTITCSVGLAHGDCARGGSGCECDCHYMIQPQCARQRHLQCSRHMECRCPCHHRRLRAEALAMRERVLAVRSST